MGQHERSLSARLDEARKKWTEIIHRHNEALALIEDLDDILEDMVVPLMDADDALKEDI